MQTHEREQTNDDNFINLLGLLGGSNRTLLQVLTRSLLLVCLEELSQISLQAL